MELTSNLEKFEAVVDKMQKRGTTAIYSSIIDAVSLLKPVAHASPSTDLRVLVLTDGQNNSGASAQAALTAAAGIGAVIDAIVVGNNPDADLRKIVAGTCGQCYQIENLGAGFELLEAESIVSLRARRGGTDKPPFQPREPTDPASREEEAANMHEVWARLEPVEISAHSATSKIAIQRP